jgi:hypothetical protein
MEAHKGDPRVGDTWQSLRNELSALGAKLRTSYREAVGEAGPSEEELRQAARTIMGGAERLGDALGRAMSDPEVRARLRQAAVSFGEAIRAAFSESGWQPPAPNQPGDQE